MHTEKLPSVISRSRKEVRRVLGVLDAKLDGKKFLVGNRLTIAGLSFVPWHGIIPFVDPSPRFRYTLENFGVLRVEISKSLLTI